MVAAGGIATRLAPRVPRRQRTRLRVRARSGNSKSFWIAWSGTVAGRQGGGGGAIFNPLGSRRLPDQSFNDPVGHLADTHEPKLRAPSCQGLRAPLTLLFEIASSHGSHHGRSKVEGSSTQKVNDLDQRKVEIAEQLRAAVAREAVTHPIKETARDAALTEARVKQLRTGDPAVISAPALILLAQRRPDLRSLLVQLMDAECGDADKSPAQILDAIMRLVR